MAKISTVDDTPCVSQIHSALPAGLHVQVPVWESCHPPGAFTRIACVVSSSFTTSTTEPSDPTARGRTWNSGVAIVVVGSTGVGVPGVEVAMPGLVPIGAGSAGTGSVGRAGAGTETVRSGSVGVDAGGIATVGSGSVDVGSNVVESAVGPSFGRASSGDVSGTEGTSEEMFGVGGVVGAGWLSARAWVLVDADVL